MGLLTKITRPLLVHGAPQLVEIPNCPKTPFYNLDASTLIGRGAVRECHHHPVDTTLCIKVTCDIGTERKRAQNNIEYYLNTKLYDRGVSARHFPRCHGWVATNYGPGLVLDRIRHVDGTTCQTALDELRQRHITGHQFWLMFDELIQWAIDNGVPIYDVELDNMVVRFDGDTPHLVLTDCGTKPKFKYVLYTKFPIYASAYTYANRARYKRTMHNEMNTRV